METNMPSCQQSQNLLRIISVKNMLAKYHYKQRENIFDLFAGNVKYYS